MKLPAEPESKKAAAEKEDLEEMINCTGMMRRGEEESTPSNASPTFTRCERFPNAVDGEDNL